MISRFIKLSGISKYHFSSTLCTVNKPFFVIALLVITSLYGFGAPIFCGGNRLVVSPVGVARASVFVVVLADFFCVAHPATNPVIDSSNNSVFIQFFSILKRDEDNVRC